jgi:hypothetical protein
MRFTGGPGTFPATLPAQLTQILTSMNVDMAGNPAAPFIDDDWRLQGCQFVNGDPSQLEIIFTGILGGRIRLTLSAKKLGQGWFEPGEIWGDGDPALTPIAKKLSSLVQETVIPKQPDVSLDMDLMTMGRSKI